MRILFTFAGGSGHVDPLIPLARAAEAAGHVVAFASRPSMVSTVEAAGFTVFPTAKREPRAPTRIPMRPLDADREDQVLRDGFAGVAARERATAILERCADWHPDLIVCDETDFGSMVAAERLGLEYAIVLVTAAGSFIRHELIAEPLNDLRAAHGLPLGPELEMLSRYLVLSPFPPSFRDPAFPLPATAHTVRPLSIEPTTGVDAPPWIEGLHGRPTVYVTLGTAFNLESGDLFARAIAGVRDLPINVVVTVGRQIDPEEFGPQPANVRIERYIPQSVLLPHCDVVVSHGGSGSVIGALAHGLPSVVIRWARINRTTGRVAKRSAWVVCSTRWTQRPRTSVMLSRPCWRTRLTGELPSASGLRSLSCPGPNTRSRCSNGSRRRSGRCSRAEGYHLSGGPMEERNRSGAIAYWALAVFLIGFGALGLLSIGMPFLLLGITLAILSRRRHETGVIPAGVAAIVGFTLGYILFAPTGCTTSSNSAHPVARTVCTNILGIDYSGVGIYNPSLLPGVIAGLVLAVLFANGGRWLARRIAAHRVSSTTVA